MIDLKPYLQQLQHGETLTTAEAAAVMEAIITGQTEPIQVAALLMALTVRGETAAEITGMLQIVRQHMTTLDLGEAVLDTCGTGGDGQGTINISTAAALVCAALDVPVAKHGNRAVSSKAGSADVLKELKIPTELTGATALQYFQQHQFVFLAAPLYHPAFKQLAPLRQTLGVRTILNLLGPLANPARAAYQLIGLPDLHLAEPIGEALMELGSKHVVLVSSSDGLDEVSVSAPTTVYDYRPNQMQRFLIEPEHPFPLETIRGGDAAFNAKIIQQLAHGEAPAAIIQVIAMNAGLALYAADRVDDYQQGKQLVEQCIRSQQLEKFFNTL